MSTANLDLVGSQFGAGTPHHAGAVRVLHLNAGNLYGGVETMLTTLAQLRHLCPDMQPHFGVCYEGRFSRELAAAGVPVHFLGAVRISRPWTVWRARRRLKKLLLTGEFDAVVCHMPWSLAVFGPVINRSSRRLVFWAHALPAGHGWLERLARRAAPDLAIANSRFTAAGLSHMFARAAQEIIYPPVALTGRQEVDEASRRRLRRQLSASEHDVVIIQVSRIEACKGHTTHLEALAHLKDMRAPWVCWMVGGPQNANEQTYFATLQESARSLGLEARVRFLGQRSDVAELLAAADIYCQPNRTPDSFGISFIEALWAGKPVVTAALGGALEIVDKSCGVLVPPGDPASLAQSLRSMIESPELRKRLGAAGPARARELSDAAQQMGRLMELARGKSQ